MSDKLKTDLTELVSSLDKAARAVGVTADVTGLAGTLTPDEPIHSTAEDRLNRSGFAAHLAKAVSNYDSLESLVIGIYGRWGTGKTSLLNLIQEQLESQFAQPPVIFRFNPWGFSDQNQLSVQFFDELSAFLKLHISIPDLAGISEAVEEYGEVISPMARLLVPRATEALMLVWRLFKKFKFVRRKTVAELKAQINSALRHSNSKLFIMLDDIDRLNAPEIRQIFQLVKLNANFVNTVYLVAFDREAVEKALEPVAPGKAKEYLEKIVQVSFSLPPIPEATLTQIIITDFNEEISRLGIKKVDAQRFGNMFQSGFRGSFRTIRDVNRYFNLLRFAVSLMLHDTDFIDLAAIEAVALFYPDVHHAIEQNPTLFCGARARPGGEERDATATRPQYEKIFATVPEDKREFVISLCEFLFPKMENVYSGRNIVYTPEWQTAWQKAKRIAAYKYFPYYFQLAVPETDVSKSELDNALESTQSASAFVESLRRFKRSNRFGAFVDLLRETLPSLSRDQLLVILESIFLFGDEVSTEQAVFLSLISEHIQFAMWLLFDILDLLPLGRFDTLIGLMRGKPAIYTISQVTSTCEHIVSKGAETERQRAKYPDLTREVVEQMKAAAVQAISGAARDGRLQNAPQLPAILYRWKQWTNHAIVSPWVDKTFLGNPRAAASFLSSFAQPITSLGLSDKVPKVRMNIPFKVVSEFVDPSKLAELLRRAPDSELTEKETMAKSLFFKAKAKFDQGQDPDSVLDLEDDSDT